MLFEFSGRFWFLGFGLGFIATAALFGTRYRERLVTRNGFVGLGCEFAIVMNG
ncbi:hypothetical protein KR52_11745 [Synechococcus sp. KORDI-52]|nr:hypothetical protein KR52_11745 [Synechococcus sp. KORDI-52]